MLLRRFVDARRRSVWCVTVVLLAATAAHRANAEVYQCAEAGGAERYSDVADSASCRLIPGLDPVKNRVAAATERGTSFATEQRRKALRPAIELAARRHGLQVQLLEAMVAAESAFRHDAVSHKGAVGLTQLMPATARELGVRNSLDPMHNLDGGARHLRALLDRFNGDRRLALAAYNAGEAAVIRYGAVPPFAETQAYVARIERLMLPSAQRSLAR